MRIVTELQPDKADAFLFGREEELRSLRQRLTSRRSFLLHGSAGVGKTFLLRRILPEFPEVLYCDQSATIQTVFFRIALSLLQRRNPHALSALGNPESIKQKSAVGLRGIVIGALSQGRYSIILDHVKQPSPAFAAGVREMMSRADTSVIAVARSSHMEDTGFLNPFYADRSEKYEIRNLERTAADQFVREAISRTALTASNMDVFVEKILQFSHGNPGAIVALVKSAKEAKYRVNETIKIAPLYIDFCMNSGAVEIRQGRGHG